jgi:hypothetical protein
MIDGTPKGLEPAAEYSPLANKPKRQRAPDAASAVNRPGAHGIVDAEYSSKSIARMTITPATAPMQAAPSR